MNYSVGCAREDDMMKKTEWTSLQIPRELSEQFSLWCSLRGRKVAPTNGAIVEWFLNQESIVQAFILAEPEVSERLADVLMKMSVKARAQHVDGIIARGSANQSRRQSAAR